MFVGKIVGALFGFMAGGPPGLILGFLVGYMFDRGLTRVLQFSSPENIERVKHSFFESTFLLSGFLAKADGRVSEQEIAHTEQLFVQLGLSADQRKEAIELFRQGAEDTFELEPAVAAFVQVCGSQRQLQQMLLLFLISLAHADQQLDPAEHAALVRIAGLMDISAAKLQNLLRMAQAQEQFHSHGAGAGGATSASGGSLQEAYVALGVKNSVNDKDLKRAYRKLMSENHPDKLIAKGVPEHMIKLATERSQEIQAAYEMIRKHRQARA